jgi:hypothetical protein
MTRRHEVITYIIEAIAEVEDCAPPELDFSLHDHIEADALLALATSGHSDWQLVFHVPDHTVSLRGNGQILVDGKVHRELDLPTTEVK